jgi:hypothetical protein
MLKLRERQPALLCVDGLRDRSRTVMVLLLSPHRTHAPQAGPSMYSFDDDALISPLVMLAGNKKKST